MIRNYFITAVRNLFRSKVFSLINIIGLAIGISAALVIFLIVQYDFSFDKFHKKGDRIYRIVSIFDFAGEIYKNSGVVSPLSEVLRKQATGLEIISPFRIWQENQKITIPASGGAAAIDLKNKEKKTIFADAAYFKLIPYKWKAGSAEASLQDPYRVVLTEKAADLYFPKTPVENIIGKEMLFDDSIKTRVSGVVEDLKENTDFTFTTFISLPTIKQAALKLNWDTWDNTNGNSQLFVQLNPGTSTQRIIALANLIYQKNTSRDPNDKSKHDFALQPLSDVHFNTDYNNFDQRIAHKPTLYGLLAVAAFLLLLGCINFINLTTAQGAQRAKEIGIRKTMGSSRNQLVLQFLSETFFITLIATLLSLAAAPLLLKVFSSFVPPELHFNLLHQPVMIIFLVGLLIAVSFLAGFYPALVLSSARPVNTLKNQSTVSGSKSRSAWIRKGLTVSQFTIAQFFILATLVVGQQIRYTLNKDIGFKKDAIIFFSTNYRDTVRSHQRILADKIKAIPGVESMSMSTGTPSSPNSWSGTVRYVSGRKEVSTNVEFTFADTNYINQFHLKVLAGKNIAASDTVNQLFINETYAHVLGFKNPTEAVGKTLIWSNRQIPVTGVIADFHFKSLHEQIKPWAMGNWGRIMRTFSVKLQSGNGDGNNWNASITNLQKAWKEVYPEEDFDYAFLDETIAQYYKSEQDISNLLKWSTGLSVFISCLGLLGLVIYTTNQRTKEIGVRKVLGASVGNIVSMLSKDFLLLVLFAFVVAAPMAWWAMNKWLEDFAYRTNLNLWLFLGAGMLTMLIALITISYQTIRTASANPVKSLRSE